MKISEAFATRGWTVSGRVGIDVGASPGSWTNWLINNSAEEEKIRIVAIDPGELKKEVLDNGERVVHMKCLAEAARLEEISKVVGEVGRDKDGRRDVVDAVVCDMNQLPTEALGILLSLSGLFAIGCKVRSCGEHI